MYAMYVHNLSVISDSVRHEFIVMYESLFIYSLRFSKEKGNTNTAFVIKTISVVQQYCCVKL